MSQSLSSIITQLQSDKVKPRQDAITLIEEALSNDKIVDRLSGSNDNWLFMFKAIFLAVSFERTAYMKKGPQSATSTASSRLEKAGHAVRTATERSVTHLPYKVVRALLDHLTSAMIGRRGLLPPLSLNYIKSIAIICSHSPHLDHLEPELWISLVSLAFAVILDDNLVAISGFAEEVSEEEEDDSQIVVDNTHDTINADDRPTGSKRGRRNSPEATVKRRTRSKTPVEVDRTPSQEEIEFMSLLVILLRSPHAPYMSPGVARKILNRLRRFFVTFPKWSTAHIQAIASVNVVLLQLELNFTGMVAKFALGMWPLLLSYWDNRKDKFVREELVVTMITFLPLVTTPEVADNPKNRIPELVEGLYNCLHQDIDRFPVVFEGLPLESLRFRLRKPDDKKNVFDAKTFCYGSLFNPSHALSWTILELHADCIRTLHIYSERYDGSIGFKRRRRDTPLSNILACVQRGSAPPRKQIDNLQVLLFVIDRHWADLHDALQQDICATLLLLLSHDDLVLQSWAFLCLAAIAIDQGKADDAIDWDTIWTQAVHRANVLDVGRAASHAAHALLASQRLPIHRVMAEVEAFAAHLVIQGPTFPFDSVCAFICDCLRIASQDVRLHRIQLPDKVLVWLFQTWNMVGRDLRSEPPPHDVTDILALLETTCSLSKPSQLSLRYPLPDSVLVDIIVERHRTAAIRDYLLYANLHPYRPPSCTQPSAAQILSPSTIPMVAPTPREAKVSAFLLQSLERMYGAWENAKETPMDATSEKVRRTFDAVVIALCFEACLRLNGTQGNRRIIQAACKLAECATACLDLIKWKPNERAFILIGLEPLISDGIPRREEDPWELIPGPGKGSGVKQITLARLSKDVGANGHHQLSPRRELQDALWKSTDVQDTFEHVMMALRNALLVITTSFQVSTRSGEEDDADFDNIQVAHSTSSTSRARGRSSELCLEICVAFLAVAPILQSGIHNATHDKKLIGLMQNCESSAFLALAPEFFQAVRNRHLHISIPALEELTDRLEEVLSKSYDSSRSVDATLLAIQFLHSTSHIWRHPNVSGSKLRRGVRLLHDWLASMVSKGKLASWRVRDRLVCYLEHCLSVDPRETFWSSSFDDQEPDDEDISLSEENALPSHLLPRLADDEDTRVRFRVAVANGRLLRTTEVTNADPHAIYERVKQELSVFLDKPEHMLTRFLHLGNAMVASSAVRRGPYWHLLETCLYQSGYTSAIEAVLTGVAARLGLPNLKSLYEAYASQLVGSLLKSGNDIFRFQPSLLGYQDRRQCARATFSLLAPMVLVAQVADSTIPEETRERAFADHCNQAQKTVSEGRTECFSDIIGITILSWIDSCDDADKVSRSLAKELRTFSETVNDPSESIVIVRRHLDRIAFSILRTVSDNDHSRGGTVHEALRRHDPSDEAATTFAALNAHRTSDDFHMHYPNFPAFSALTVLRSLIWLDSQYSGVFSFPVVYHVLHHFMAAISNSPLVNEQIRLLHGLAIWISINGASFKDVTLHRTLLRGAIILLSQSDLAHIVQGMLEWAFSRYECIEPTFPDLLGRIARIAHDYSRNSDDPVLSALGNDLMDWIEKQAWILSQKDAIRPQILSALSLWPRQPCGPLAFFAQELNQSEPLSDILQNQQGTFGKFRLVRRLRDLADADAYAQEQFCDQDFWHLKHCIPQLGEMQDEDVDAFVDILFKHTARIRPLSVELMASNSAAELHIQASRDARLVDKDRDNLNLVSPLRSIIFSLMKLLSTEVASQVYRAYNTLRLLFALSIAELQGADAWSSPYEDEISYLHACPLYPVATAVRSLDELQTSERLRTTDFPSWICDVATLLNDVLATNHLFYAQLFSFIQSDASFASQMLPVLVHGVLQSDQTKARTVLSEYFSSILREGVSSQRCRSVVETVLHLRNFDPTSVVAKDPLAYDKWLNIDFRLLSRGAMSCGAYTTALLFLELAADYSQSSTDTEAAIEEILYDIYSHIEEPDGFYAIKSNDIHGFLTRRFHHEGEWDMAFKFHGADFAAGFRGSRGAEGITQSLHSNGFHKLAMAVLQSSTSETVETTPVSSQLGYELAWRTQVWDLPEPHDDGQVGSALYTALRAIHRNRDPQTVDTLLRSASRQELSYLHSTGNEDMVGVRSRVQTLLCLGEIRKWWGVTLQAQRTTGDTIQQAWQDIVDISSEFDFTTLERIIATRMSLILSIKQREQRQQIGDLESPFVSDLRYLEKGCLVRLSEAARLSEHYQTALNACIHAQRLEHAPSFGVSQEFAHVLWLLKERRLAVDYLKGLVPGVTTPPVDREEATRNALILSRLGTWSAEACLQKPTDIREHFFTPATTLILGTKSQVLDKNVDPAPAVVFHQYALFAEQQYHAILKSPEVSRLQVYVERKKQEIEQLKESLRNIPESNSSYVFLSQHQRKAETIYQEDIAQISVHTESKKIFLVQAIEMYSRCLQASDEFDDSAVIRICSLWFANFNEPQVQSYFSQALARVPSRKFIFLAHQLSARLSTPDKSTRALPDSQKLLQALIVRMCNEHPFHSLYQVWALQQGSLENDGRRHSARGGSVSLQSGRASAARDILSICRQHTPNTHRVQAIERVCKAYLEWAKYPLLPKKLNSEQQSGQHKVPKILLREISNLPIPVTTAHTPLDYTLRYDSIVTIARYSSFYSLAGGLNLPKISDCHGSDGNKYKQLFKGEGNDDLRQDAVMEQVFELVNLVLKRDRQTRKRQLSVRRYKVIPLAPQAGLLEYVTNTLPIRNWLVPAHKRYRPNDLSPNVCTETLKKYRQEHDAGALDAGRMQELFLKMMQKFRPVFRHFFTENYKLPMAWFASRLNYARSAATASIVGHVLGLGDRHVSNILLDRTTGELIHIDLGIAFDQGKQLKVPELVPFRLTPDIVDGLGTAGTEGVFRRCAEETLRVLRTESGVITTVLEVFRHDPLHSWTANAIKIKRVQGSFEGSNTTVDTNGAGFDLASNAADESADRALTSVHRKLERSLSVEYTVNELITSATDPGNLSLIWFGWSPHL